MALSLLAALLLPQDPDIQRLVRDLGDERPEVREAATRKLVEKGGGAFEALRRAAGDKDPEISLRAREIVTRIESDLAQAALEKEQRPKKLRLVSLDVTDAPLGDVLAKLGDSTGLKFTTKNIDLSRRVSLKAQEMPLIQALEMLGITYNYFSPQLVFLGEPKPTAYAPGAMFRFSMERWPQKGAPQGTVIYTVATPDYDGEIDWDPAAIQTDVSVPFETCAVHSPEAVFVRDPGLREPKLSLKARRRWYCDIPVEFKDPKEGDSRRIGRIELAVRWPHIVVGSDDPLPKPVLQKTVGYLDIRVELRPGIDLEEGFASINGIEEGTSESSRTWCGCESKPTQGPRKAPETSREHRERIPAENALGDVAKISVTFHKPVEESFEVTSPAIK